MSQNRSSALANTVFLYLFYAHGIGWTSCDPRETAAT
jgi:hypothetical protein